MGTCDRTARHSGFRRGSNDHGNQLGCAQQAQFVYGSWVINPARQSPLDEFAQQVHWHKAVVCKY